MDLTGWIAIHFSRHEESLHRVVGVASRRTSPRRGRGTMDDVRRRRPTNVSCHRRFDVAHYKLSRLCDGANYLPPGYCSAQIMARVIVARAAVGPDVTATLERQRHDRVLRPLPTCRLARARIRRTATPFASFL